MENAAEENWKVLLSLFPAGWETAAVNSGAVERLRGFDSAEALLRTLLLHIARGYSLRETVVQAKLADLASVSDVALLKRLRNSEAWLRSLCLSLLRENGISLPEAPPRTAVRLIDGTVVKEPGKTGSQWRLLFSLRLPGLDCDYLEVTSTEGKGSGESFRRVPVYPHEFVLADAGYCSAAGIEYVQQQGADVLVRVNPLHLVAYSSQHRKLNWVARLRSLSEPGQFGDWQISVRGEQGWITGRLCAVRKSEHAIQQAHRHLRRKATRKQMQLKSTTLETAKYVVVYTSRLAEPSHEILEWYRLRWQIELAFKRFKSLAQLGHLPKYDDRSSRAWLYGKLLVALLTQKLIRLGRDISPWGYSLAPSTTAKPLA